MGCQASKNGAVVPRNKNVEEEGGSKIVVNDSVGSDDKTCYEGSEWTSSDESPPGSEQKPGGKTPKSKLDSPHRRRLSVSTINGGVGIADQLQEARKSKELADKTYGAQHSPSKKYPAQVPGNRTRRTYITKFSDPAMELVDKTKGSIKKVTLQMLRDLFPEAEHYCVFGSPAENIQRGFDSKVEEIDGVMPPNKTLQDIGVGFSCKKGLKPESPNQDDFFILRVDDWAMYGVFDGHGPYGHDVSGFVHRTLPFLIVSDPQFETDTAVTLKRAFRKVHHLVEAATECPSSNFDCTLSGTTGTVIVQKDRKLYVAHVGDSRAVMGRKSGEKYKAVNLTHDHKPTRPEEKQRIVSRGGEVRRLEGDIPFRVFIKNRLYPGLAMSRAIGDIVGSTVGVIPDPDVKVVELTEDDKFFTVSTDGVWEFISSQEAVDFISKRKPKQVQEASEMLAYESWRRWVEEEVNVVDDITCLIIWNINIPKKNSREGKEKEAEEPEKETDGRENKERKESKEKEAKDNKLDAERNTTKPDRRK